jgi:hypothetical protein
MERLQIPVVGKEAGKHNSETPVASSQSNAVIYRVGEELAELC